MKFTAYAFSLCALAASPVLAQETPVAGTSSISSTSVGTIINEDPLVTEFASRFGVPREDVAALRQAGISWTEIGNAISVASRSTRPLRDVTALRATGLDWNSISQRFGIVTEAVQDDVRAMNQRITDFQLQNRELGRSPLPTGSPALQPQNTQTLIGNPVLPATPSTSTATGTGATSVISPAAPAGATAPSPSPPPGTVTPGVTVSPNPGASSTAGPGKISGPASGGTVPPSR